MTEKFHHAKRLLTVGLLMFFLLFDQAPVQAENGRMLIPAGQTVGITLNMEGVTVVDTADVTGYDGKCSKPAEEAGLRPGDMIEEINGEPIDSAQELETLVNEQGGAPLEIKLMRSSQEKRCQVQPALSAADGRYRLGVWIKDAVSGIGALTYLDPETLEFGALGHSITEDAGEAGPPLQGGNILKASVVSVQKGTKGQPGELVGVFSEDKEKLGVVRENTGFGLKGVLDKIPEGMPDPVPAASRRDVIEGPAEILCCTEGDKIRRFAVEIQKINKDTESAKGMVVKITDPTLLEKTGGIVQGMSGSPILQNGKLVGAVTHVFVSDPTRGYGIFIEQMLR